MWKYLLCVPLAAALWQTAGAAVIDPYQMKGCRYEGGVNQSNQPHGDGEWACQDGRSYKGRFKDGRFEGKGTYTVRTRKEIFLEPFNVNSTKLNNMELSGRFKQGLADGKFEAVQDGAPLFSIVFEKGFMKKVQLPDTKKK